MNEKAGKKPEVTPVAATAQTKATEVTPTDTKTAEAKTAETKTLEAKAAEVKAAASAVEAKATEKLASVKETVKETVKEEVKKAPKKKTTRKAASKKESGSDTEVFVEYYGQQSSVEEIANRVKDAFVAEGHRASTIKSLKLYLKPEDGAAYYVINEKFAGRVNLF